MKLWTIAKLATLALGVEDLVSCVSLADIATASPSCLPNFPLKDGWLGGDAAFSVALGGGNSRTLWIFGDTFVDPSKELRTRKGTIMPSLSIGISECKNGNFDLHYYWGQKRSPFAFAPFFDPGDNAEIWPGGGVSLNQGMVLFANQLDRNPEYNPPWGYRLVGSSLIHVEKIDQVDPRLWSYEIRTVYQPDGRGESDLLVGVSVLSEGEYLYLFSAMVTGPQHTVLLRLPKNKLHTEALELLTTEGWKLKSAASLDQAEKILLHSSTEFSFYRLGDGSFRAVYTDTSGSFPFSKVMLAASDRLEGPYEPVKALLEYPGEDTLGFPQPFCYAAKDASAVLAQGATQRVLTFVCHTQDNESLLSNLGTYRIHRHSYDAAGHWKRKHE